MSKLYHLFADNVLKNPGRVAIAMNNGDKISYKELQELVDTIASNLLVNLKPGQSRIAINLKNSIELVAIFLAISKVDMVAIPINTLLRSNQVSHALLSTDADIIITSDQSYSYCMDLASSLAAKRLMKVIKLSEIIDSNECSSKINSSFTQHSCYTKDKEGGFIVTLSSGSTGQPKPIVFSQETKIRRSLQAKMLYGIKSDDVILCASPLYHSLGQRLTFLPLLNGCTLVLLDSFSSRKWINVVKQFQVTFTIPVTSHLQVLRQPLLENIEDLTSLRCIVSSSATIDYELKSKLLNQLRCEFHEMYGASEIATATNLYPSDPDSKSKSVGKPCTGVDILILDDARNVQPTGEIGEIACKSPMRFTHYYGKPDATQASIHDDYFLTGDLGYLDSDGYLFFVARKKDVIITGGINVFPRDIEQVLGLHPHIKDCSVIGVNDAYLGEAILAICVATDYYDGLEKDIRILINDKLAGYQQPLGYFFVDSLPLTPSGKINKQEMREIYNALNLDLSAPVRAILSTNN